MELKLRHLVGLLVAVVALTGCATLQDVPLPGLVSGPTFRVEAEFANALGLPEQAAVRYSGSVVGEVVSVTTKDYKAIVELKIVEDAKIPADSTAEIRLSSPMGETFIEIAAPSTPEAGAGRLREGSRIPLKSTSGAPSATDLLASVSTLVTGGSFADMKVIITELNKALTGNSGNVRQLIGRLDHTLTGLNNRTAQFDTALNALDRTARQLAGDRALIGQTIDAVGPAVAVLAGQREQVLSLMARLRKLSAIASPTIAQARRSLTSVLHDLGPVLDTLVRNEDTFAPIFQGIHDFGTASDAAGYGLFANFDLTTIFDPTDLGLLNLLSPRSAAPPLAPTKGVTR